jgi:hypothetical protein
MNVGSQLCEHSARAWMLVYRDVCTLGCQAAAR